MLIHGLHEWKNLFLYWGSHIFDRRMCTSKQCRNKHSLKDWMPHKAFQAKVFNKDHLIITEQTENSSMLYLVICCLLEDVL